MGGGFSVGGLITGLDTNNIIRQLIEIERQPILRIEERIKDLEAERTAISDLRDTLLALRNRAQDFRLGTTFSRFQAPSTDESVLTASVTGDTPTTGAFSINISQLATATVATSSDVLGGAIDPNAVLNNSGLNTQVQAGAFSINGVSINIDPDTQSLNDIINAINVNVPNVSASYDAVTDTLTFENDTAGDTNLINFGASDDTTNFLEAINILGATQSTGPNGSTVATSTRNLGAVNPDAALNTVNFRNGAVTDGTIFVNGVEISVDPATDSISDIVARINSADAQVRATYDSATDRIRVVSETLGSRTIGFASGSSNFLEVANLAGANPATQTAGTDSEFSIDGGPVQTRNTNQISDVIGGVTLNLQSLGTATINVESDTASIVEDVRGFIEEFNTALSEISTELANDGALRGDGTIRAIENFLRSTIFSSVDGINGQFDNLINIGINTGDQFVSTGPFELQLDEEAFIAALEDDATNVEQLFSNDGETGVADVLFNFLDAQTKSTGPLNQRARPNGTLDQQIQSQNDRIERLEDRIAIREQRLRQQFAQLETLSAQFQQQSTALLGLQSGLAGFGQGQ